MKNYDALKRKPRHIALMLFLVVGELVLSLFFLTVFPYTRTLLALHFIISSVILPFVLTSECDGIYKAICCLLLAAAPIISSISLVCFLIAVKRNSSPYTHLQYGTFNDFKYFKSGKDFFKDLLEKLHSAKGYIYLEYYIVKNGKIWESIKNAITQKAEDGVKVSVALDAFGCYGLPKNLKKWLKSHKIDCVTINPLSILPNLFFGCRSHRKIAVIDDAVYIGGINLADEYATDDGALGKWKDAAIRLDGSISKIFSPHNKCADIKCSQDEILYADAYLSSPFGRAILRDVYVQLLCKNKTTCFATPYLSPDYTLLQAMKFSILQGNTVKIYLPDVPDKKGVYALTKIYAEEIAAAGGEIYCYKPGFLHAKLCLSGDTVVIGSGNLDYRSFYLQYECGIITDCCEIADTVKEDFLSIEKASERLTFPTRNSFFSKLFYSLYKTFFKLFAPLV